MGELHTPRPLGFEQIGPERGKRRHYFLGVRLEVLVAVVLFSVADAKQGRFRFAKERGQLVEVAL